MAMMTSEWMSNLSCDVVSCDAGSTFFVASAGLFLFLHSHTRYWLNMPRQAAYVPLLGR